MKIRMLQSCLLLFALVGCVSGGIEENTAVSPTPTKLPKLRQKRPFPPTHLNQPTHHHQQKHPFPQTHPNPL